MTKLNSPLISLEAVGRLTKSLAFKRKGHRNIIEKKPQPTDAKSLAQLSWRHMYLKAVALWHALSPAEQQEWESLARPKHMTGFAWFMSQALKPNPGLYLPLQGGTMAGDIDMDSNRLLNLIDPTLDQEPVTKKYYEDNLPPYIAAHAAIEDAHHAKYTDAEALAAAIAGGLSEVIWKDDSAISLDLGNRTSDIGWTDVDLTADTSADAKLAIIIMYFVITVTCTSDPTFRVRKNGTTPTYYPIIRFKSAEYTAAREKMIPIIVGLDSGQVLEYYLECGGGTVTAQIQTLGYIE